MIRFGLFIGRPDLWGDSTGYYSKLAWTFVIGQQPGWLMFGILDEFDKPDYAPQRAVLKGLVACRLAAVDFLQYGQFLRPLDLPCRRARSPGMTGPPPAPALSRRCSTESGGPRMAHRDLPGELDRGGADGAAAGLAGVGPARRLLSRSCLSGKWGAPIPVAQGGLVVHVPARATMVVELRGE